MIVRVGFLVAASIAAYAAKQISVKSPKRQDTLKKPSGTLISLLRIQRLYFN